MIWRIVGSLLGAVLILIGIPLTISPIPLGILLVAIGVIVLIGANPWFARFIRDLRKKSKPVDDAFRKAGEVLPEPVAEPLRQTEVETDDDDETSSGAKMGPPLHRFHNPRNLR